MKSLVIRLDEGTHRALLKAVAWGGKGRAEFIRDAIRKAVRAAEYARMRRAYQAQPDSESQADGWPAAEEYRN